jgi:hypothetical protein
MNSQSQAVKFTWMVSATEAIVHSSIHAGRHACMHQIGSVLFTVYVLLRPCLDLFLTERPLNMSVFISVSII